MRNTEKNSKKRIEQDQEQPTNSGELENVSRDITMHDKTEKPVHDTDMRYRALFENANDAIFLMEVDKFVECNPKTCEMFGCTPEQIIGKTPYYPYSPEFQPDGRESKEKALEKIQLVMQGQSQLFNWRHKKYNGYIFDAEVSLNRLELSGTVFVQAIVRDITERKQLEEQLKKSEEKYQTLVEHVNEIIFMHDADSVLTYISPQCEKITGYTAQEIIGQKWTTFATDSPLNKQALDILEEAREIDKPPVPHQVEIRKKDGNIIILEVNDRILRNEEGDVTGVVGSARDITNQKLIEQALAESEQKFRTFFENEPEYCYMLSPQGKILEANSAALSVLGYAKEELIGKPIESLYAPELSEKVRQLLSQWKQTGEIRNEEMVIITKNGDRRTVLLSSAQVLGENGKPLHSISIQRDITEYKRLEEAYRSLVDNSLQGLAIVQDGRMVFLNKAFTSTTGYSKEDLLAASPEQLQSLVHPDDRELVWTRHRDRIAGKPVSPRYEFRWRRKDGSTCWVEINASRIEYQGRPAIQAAYIDMTERRQAEEALRAERDKLKALMDGINRAGIGIDIIGANYEVLFQNKILEEDCGELRGKCCYEHYMAREEPCSPCPAMDAIKKQKTASVEQVGSNGRDYQVFSAPLPDTDGTVSKAIEIVIEITEHKKAQQKLFEYQKQLKSLASELLLAEERERRRIATGVHDDIGQKLALAKLELQSIQATVSEPDVSASLGHACELIDKGIQDSRLLAFDLSNPVLYEVGFTAAVESLLTGRMIQKSGIKTEFKTKIHKLKLDQDMSIVLFQAVRELLTNVVKHANANKVKVCIDESDKRVQVIVEDDGAGFDLLLLRSPDKEAGGFGLFNVKERLEYLGGSFDIKSKPRRGTRVTIVVPLESGVTAS